MRSKLIILGCGSSIGVPRIDGFWGNCKKNEKKNNRTRCSALIVKGSNKILIKGNTYRGLFELHAKTDHRNVS